MLLRGRHQGRPRLLGDTHLPRRAAHFTQPFSNATLTGIGAITGGTGKYAGATGTFEATGRAGTDPQVYDYTVRLLD